MNRFDPLNSYRQVATQTAPKGQLVLMLYDAALRFLDRAQQGFGFEDPLDFHQTINNNILRAQEIINELNRCLNLEAGGRLAETMRGLYHYFDRRLQASNLEKSMDGLKEVQQRLSVLREAWAQMLQQQQQGEASQALPTTCSLSVTG